MSAVVSVFVKSVESVFGVFSSRTWCALIVVSVTGGALVFNHYRQKQDELLQRVVCRDKTTLLTGPITDRLPKSFKLVTRKEGVFIFESAEDPMTTPVYPVPGLPRFQCPFPSDKHVGKMNFANAVLLGLAHDPVVYFFFDELLRSDTVEKIVDYGRSALSAAASNVTFVESDDDEDDLVAASDSSSSSSSSSSSAESVAAAAATAAAGTTTSSVPAVPVNSYAPALVSASCLRVGRRQAKIKVPSRSKMLPRAKEVFFRMWDSPLRPPSTPSRESLKAMDSGIDTTDVLRAVKLYARRQHPERRCESIEDFVWLFLNGVADEIDELENQLETVDEEQLSFRDCILGNHRVSLWCLDCGRFSLVETDAITVTYDKILNEDLCDPLDKSIRKCIEKRRRNVGAALLGPGSGRGPSGSARRSASGSLSGGSATMADFFEPDNPCKHNAFRCLSCVPSMLSNSLVVYIPDSEITSFPLSHSLQVEHDKRRIYDVQLVVYCTNLVTKDAQGADVLSESYSCAFKNAADGHWYFFDGHDNYYRLPDGSPRDLKKALHFVPPHLLMYTSREWPLVRDAVRKAWTRPRKNISGRRQGLWKESIRTARAALRYASSAF